MKQTILFLLLGCCLALSGAVLPAAAQAQTPTRTPLVSTSSTSAPADEVTKTACAAAFGFPSLDALKSEILVQAKRAAINELFGELIAASTQVENFAVTSDQIQALSAGFVRVRSDSYTHGPNLGDVCVTIVAYTTEEDRAKFVPVPIQKRNCVTDAAMSVGQIRQYAQEEVLVKAMVEYDRRLADTEREALLRLLRRVTYSESGFLTGTESYCVTARGEVTPVEVIALVEGLEVAFSLTPGPSPKPGEGGRTATPTPTRTPPGGATPSAPQRTATAFAATATAFANRTATATPTPPPTPDATGTAITLMVAAMETAQAAPHQVYELWVNPVDDAVYVYVPEGKFTMGAGDGQPNEQPVHKVTLDAFWIMRTEVTNAQYGRCVRSGVCTAPENSVWKDVRYAEHPVVNVDWNQATTYAQWVQGRLPTEAEWEKACRGDDLRTYPWGDAEPTASLLNFSGSGVGGTTAVGSYPTGASPYGALDQAGNVWEWTADWYSESYYGQSPEANPTGPASGQYRVLRGGSFYNDSTYVRCAVRVRDFPDSRYDDRGFRVAVGGGVPPR